MTGERDGLPRSLQVRLTRHAKDIGVDPNLVLTRYAVERFLYRLSRALQAHKLDMTLRWALEMVPAYRPYRSRIHRSASGR